MTSTLSSAEIDRKELKRPDAISSSLQAFFEGMFKNSRAAIAALGAVVVLLIGMGIVMSRSETRSDEAKAAFFAAEKTFQAEMKALSEAARPAQKAEDAKKTDRNPAPESVAFTKFDVEAKLPESIKKFQSVAKDFPGTRSAYEARFALGSLYFDHGQAEKSIPWFEKSAETAPNSQEKTLALVSLGYALESSGKPAEAISRFEKALNLGEAALKGELLLAIARNHEQLKDTAKARTTYDQILSQLPNTEFSRAAEQFKSQLE